MTSRLTSWPRPPAAAHAQGRGNGRKPTTDLDDLLRLDVSPALDGQPVVITASGEIDMASVTSLDDCLTTLGDAGSPVVLDLEEVSFIDSSGMAALVRARKRFRAVGCTFALRNVAPNVAKALALAGLGQAFDIE